MPQVCRVHLEIGEGLAGQAGDGQQEDESAPRFGLLIATATQTGTPMAMDRLRIQPTVAAAQLIKRMAF
ncbi:MAG: hypothetical protein JW839_05010 [Candidatus Lokiarchaeota archaeon]|nr:hypothetical protein [Candidatus Lokiarchaeota archaeon]